MKEFIAEFFAVLNSSKFTQYTSGVSITLPTGQSVLVKIKQITRSIRPKGLRFSKFAFVTEVMASEHLGVGFGEGPTRLVALQKSIAEGVERALFHAVKNTPFGTSNSNGWAAHLSMEKASAAALSELLERDAVLVHWICKEGMAELNPSTWPHWLKQWNASELNLSQNFNQLRILISRLGHIPSATVLLLNKNNNAVLSHATAKTMEEAIQKALIEACRIGHMAMEFQFQKESFELRKPTDHALYYAFHDSIPSWIFGVKSSWAIEHRSWKNRYKKFNSTLVRPKFHKISEKPLSVGFCTSEAIQNLFFGRTEEAAKNNLLNFDRLKTVRALEDLNIMPHWVP